MLYNGESRNSNYDDLLWVQGPRVGNWSRQRAGWGTSSKNRLKSPLIYIYIFILRQTVSLYQLFSVARPGRCFKPRSKPGWLYVSQISYPRTHVILSAKLILRLSFYIYDIGYQSAQFMRRAIAFQRMGGQAKFPTRVLNLRGGGDVCVCVCTHVISSSVGKLFLVVEVII